MGRSLRHAGGLSPRQRPRTSPVPVARRTALLHAVPSFSIASLDEASQAQVRGISSIFEGQDSSKQTLDWDSPYGSRWHDCVVYTDRSPLVSPRGLR